MKQAEIIKVLAMDFGTSDIKELNKLLKSKTTPEIKYRITGKKLGHQGFNGSIKGLTEEGVKVFNIHKVSLIKFVDMERFEKSKPKVARPVRAKSTEATPKRSVKEKTPKEPAEDADDEGFKKRVPRASSFIPAKSHKSPGRRFIKN